jgi:hypothetical protein
MKQSLAVGRPFPPARVRWPLLGCVVLAAIGARYLVDYVVQTLRSADSFPVGDFFAIWSYARFLGEHRAVELYDLSALHAAQVGWGMPAGDVNPFPYPPTFILALWPLQSLEYWTALWIWLAVGFGLYGAALLTAAGPYPTSVLAVLLVMLAPTTTLTLVAGQSGFLAAALLVGGARLVGTRPIGAGVLFGLLTYKPQLGMLVPVALLAAGQWRCIASAAATTALLVAATAVAFGGPIWPAWLAALPEYQDMFARSTHGHRLMATVLTNLEAFGAPARVAGAAQALASLGSAVVVWVCWRWGPRDLATAALLAGTCLALPHAFLYDLPILTGAVVVFLRARLLASGRLDRLEWASVTAVLAFPAAMAFCTVHLPVSGVATAVFLGVVCRSSSGAPSTSRATA